MVLPQASESGDPDALVAAFKMANLMVPPVVGDEVDDVKKIMEEKGVEFPTLPSLDLMHFLQDRGMSESRHAEALVAIGVTSASAVTPEKLAEANFTAEEIKKLTAKDEAAPAAEGAPPAADAAAPAAAEGAKPMESLLADLDLQSFSSALTGDLGIAGASDLALVTDEVRVTRTL